ncbi:MAG: bile acid:sodium symporter [Polyangiaceae bacterium]|nr:bile acid:sodium symporter [Myxococcales bacterium]MCB9584330.1 bile acid:sodium symporter [Polyangiaceae bacterium]
MSETVLARARVLLTERFWLLAYCLLGLGLLIEIPLEMARQAIPVCLGAVLYFTCLKVSPRAVLVELRRPRAARRLTALIVVKLFGLPLLVFISSLWLPEDDRLGLLILAAMPAGMSSVAFADVHRGNVALALLVLLATSLLSPVSVPLSLELPRLLGKAQAHALTPSEVAARVSYIAVLLGVPFVAAQVTRRAAAPWVARQQGRFTPLALVSLLALIFLATSATRARWFEQGLSGLLAVLVMVSLTSLAFLGTGALAGRIMGREDAVAFGCNCVYVNNGLAVAYALAFYPERPGVVLPCILITVPMVWVIGWVGRAIPLPAAEARMP